MDALSAELPSPPAGEELPIALARHLRERERTEGLVVALEVEGEAESSTEAAGEGAGARLSPAEAAALLRIVQEALNNVAKHAGTSSATVRLRLRRPCRLEIEDRGRGFDPEQVDDRGLGLDGMRERAAEIGWSLAIASSPGAVPGSSLSRPARAPAGRRLTPATRRHGRRPRDDGRCRRRREGE